MSTNIWEEMGKKAIAVLNKHIVPDGISDKEALAELYGIFDGPLYRDAVAWKAAEEIAEKPEVHDALQGFSEDPTGTNGTVLVREIMRAINCKKEG